MVPDPTALLWLQRLDRWGVSKLFLACIRNCGARSCGCNYELTCKAAVGVRGARSGWVPQLARRHRSSLGLCGEDARLAGQRHDGPTEPLFEVSGRFSAAPNAIALSTRIPEENEASEASSPGNFWFPRVFGVSRALPLNIEANPAGFPREEH